MHEKRLEESEAKVGAATAMSATADVAKGADSRVAEGTAATAATATNSEVLRDLREMFRDGKRLLELNQELQREETAKIEREKREVARRRADAEREAKRLLLLLSSSSSSSYPDDDDVPFEVEPGPMWSHGNATCTLPVRGAVGAGVLQVGKQQQPALRRQSSGSRPPSRPGSQPGSRSASTVRDHKSPSVAAAPSSGPRKQRPRSAYLSPQGRLSVAASGAPTAATTIRKSPVTTSSGQGSGQRVFKSRAGSMSPSSGK